MSMLLRPYRASDNSRTIGENVVDENVGAAAQIEAEQSRACSEEQAKRQQEAECKSQPGGLSQYGIECRTSRAMD